MKNRINRMNNIALLFFVFVSIISLSCVSVSILKEGEVETKPSETSGDKESWVNSDEDSFIEDDYLFFRTQTEDDDLNYARRVSMDAEAVERAISAVQTIARRQFGEAVKRIGIEGKAGLSGENIIVALAEADLPSPIRVKLYWEKYMKGEQGNKVSYMYRVWGLYNISVEDYEQAKQEAWAKAVEDVRQRDQDAAEEYDKVKEEFLGTRAK